MIRNPVVSGKFYPGSATSLEAQIREFIDEGATKEEVLGVVSPHAGYSYSGPVAGAVLSRVKFKDTFVIMGPNHTGLGQPFSIMTEGTWRTPLGNVEIDTDLAIKILEMSPPLKEDHIAHLEEHSIEVQIPFLQYLKKGIRIVPILLTHADSTVYKEIGKGIAEAIKDQGGEAVIMASSDMTHYEDQDSASRKDLLAIVAILELNEDELLKRIGEYHITMCGYAPVASLISACKDLGAEETELVKYQTSGDVIRDFRSVVGYAGIIIKRGVWNAPAGETG
ncbi:MAG: MEMO1 family protein [Dehalococcoidia bacterium]|nr:MEMO1 family protein [Dehalococcoidia bacterium]